MKIYWNQLLILFLLIAGHSICCGKNLKVEEILSLPADRSATDTPILDSNNEICALIKLPFPKVDETVISGDQIFKKEYHGNEWYIYMPPETFKFFIKHPGFDDLEIDLSKKFPRGVEAGKTYKVTVDTSELTPIETRNEAMEPAKSESTHSYSGMNNSYMNPITSNKKEIIIQKNSLYFQGGYNVMGLSGLNIGIGGYFRNFNIEANYNIGLTKSDDIYWNNTSGDIQPILTTYSPMGFNFKIGYGIRLGDKFRITPRVGMQYVVLQEKSSKKIANNANAIVLPIGVKIDFAMIKHFGISLEPSYNISINQSEGYKVLSEISSKIKGYSDGFGLNISFCCNF